MQPPAPSEVITLILKQCDRADLPAVSRASKNLLAHAGPILYRHISVDEKRISKLIRTPVCTFGLITGHPKKDR